MFNILNSLIVLFVFDYVTSASLPCSQIAKCDESYKERDICISYRPTSSPDVSYYNISSCKKNMTCEKNEIGGTEDVMCIKQKDKRLYFDGERCVDSSACYSGNCTEGGYCIGFPKNAPCTQTEQCGKELLCFNGKCTKLVPIGGVCTSDYDCVIEAGCLLSVGKCIPYFSLKSGEKTTKPDLCETGFADYFGANLVCAEKILTNDDCAESEKCTFEKKANGYTTIIFTEDCKCSLNYFDKKFCGLGTTNSTYKEAIQVMNETRNTHTSLRLKPGLEYDRKLVLKALAYPKFKDVDSCVLDLYLSAAYIPLFLSALLIALLLI